ncbi:hypothetical protein DEM27_33045 [Metarhizobium album]|uniref:Uncharacterized protein n=1 Tax=Metarhizobium album TaxID=2182425 RepID=A0A2U2DFF3_9HYPH|nr:hypothetical protein [Rhizobium album]PWE52045.1 hypothetical protein DEM27_33045 [Rhizobium album]
MRRNREAEELEQALIRAVEAEGFAVVVGANEWFARLEVQAESGEVIVTEVNLTQIAWRLQEALS